MRRFDGYGRLIEVLCLSSSLSSMAILRLKRYW
jgi:hypothetical protein